MDLSTLSPRTPAARLTVQSLRVLAVVRTLRSGGSGRSGGMNPTPTYRTHLTYPSVRSVRLQPDPSSAFMPPQECGSVKRRVEIEIGVHFARSHHLGAAVVRRRAGRRSFCRGAPDVRSGEWGFEQWSPGHRHARRYEPVDRV